ncbi:MAG: RhuM family protein [Panacagrimonas sp.]
MTEIQIYDNGEVELEVRYQSETLWLNLGQIADLFGVQKPGVSKHLRNIFTSGELSPEATVSRMETVQAEGGRTVRRNRDWYNLDAIISVGYRVNSAKATRFRQWATGVLRQHLTQGYSLNRQRLESNARELDAALQLVRKAMQAPQLTADDGRGLLDIVTGYAQTFLLLQRYDEGLLTDPPAQPGGTLPTVAEARRALALLKASLINKGQATALFAQERVGDGLAALLGNLDQTALGDPVYPSIEAKAAHLLYFVIKNHPFVDGNKRSGAYLFVDFLHRNGRLLDTRTGQPLINDLGLAALALLVAESPAQHKDTMVRLIMNMLARPSTQSGQPA